MPDFKNIEYLRTGNPVQRECYRVLKKSGIMELLASYSPVVVGTIPIGLDVPGSDIDILCQCSDFAGLEKMLRGNFYGMEGFRCGTMYDALVCSFIFEGMEIEVFAQDIPVTLQNGYRHMITEYALLEIHGEEFRQEIIALKKSGNKTEPAFARVLNLKGDPYEAMLEKGRELG